MQKININTIKMTYLYYKAQTTLIL